MHGPINVKSPNNISKWQMGFNSAFKGLINYKPLPAFVLRGVPFVSGTRVWNCRSQANPLLPPFLPTPR